MANAADDLAARGLHDIGRVTLERLAEDVVGGEEEPRVVAPLHHGAASDLGKRVGVVGPLHRRRRAGLAGEIRRAAAGDKHGLVLLGGEGLNREGDGGGRQVDDGIDLLVVEPVARDSHTDVRLVLMVRADDLDRLAEHLAAEILGRHLRRRQRALAGAVRIDARHVGQHAEFHDVIRDLRASGRERGGGQSGGK